MKAPDKIYIRPMLNPSDGYVGIAWAEAHGGIEEYVRKDALLEWAKELKHIYELPVHGRQANPICLSKAEVFQMVIDKIESI